MITIILVMLFIGVIFIAVNITKIKTEMTQKTPRVIYRYIPRTFEAEQEDPVPASDVFDTLFSQPSPWIDSVRTYDRHKQEKINTYFVSQM
uniref:Uncharacterized protein n=1 Tax=Mimivirus LCMiAC01 TaxID=2506608 RepID=A0A481Z047_9VIRU|nr:MAG: hypothetical protein LCMiAC01_05640 [Mimivirus LCMiAC01]